MQGPEKESSLPRQSTIHSANEPLGQTHFFVGSVEPRLSRASVLRTGTDINLVHFVYQSQPGAASSSFPGPEAGQNYPAPNQDPSSLVRDERPAFQRRDASHEVRDVHLFSNSQRADVRETTFRVTDRSEGAIMFEMPSQPTPEFVRALQAVLGHRSGNTTGTVPSAAPATGPILSITGPTQPPYVVTGHNVPGYYQPAHLTHGYSLNHGVNGAYPGINYPPPPANYAPMANMNTSDYGSPTADGHHASPFSPPPPPYPHPTTGQPWT
ncbi:hypothetical protein D9758_005758 [Tetrapyrgos nigripes]|uniref:Uncharacterized protein n=1 Tax=Tetrapyrgos nigripes TaxID=182062 RepID=A0A8H5LQW4_9AGAR|nr:hypothetical protein D9758_005758 [Tetrapyrgos nigripes]